MKVFINPGHAPNGVPDPGAVNQYSGLKEAVVVKHVGDLVAKYLIACWCRCNSVSGRFFGYGGQYF